MEKEAFDTVEELLDDLDKGLGEVPVWVPLTIGALTIGLIALWMHVMWGGDPLTRPESLDHRLRSVSNTQYEYRQDAINENWEHRQRINKLVEESQAQSKQIEETGRQVRELAKRLGVEVIAESP